MSSGSWLSHGGTDDGIGLTPGGMGPDERLFLGWLDHQVVEPGQEREVHAEPGRPRRRRRSGTTQAVVVNLPDKTTSTTYTAPPEGTHAWWSGRDDNLNNTLPARCPPPAASR